MIFYDFSLVAVRFSFPLFAAYECMSYKLAHSVRAVAFLSTLVWSINRSKTKYEILSSNYLIGFFFLFVFVLNDDAMARFFGNYCPWLECMMLTLDRVFFATTTKKLKNQNPIAAHCVADMINLNCKRLGFLFISTPISYKYIYI